MRKNRSGPIKPGITTARPWLGHDSLVVA